MSCWSTTGKRGTNNVRIEPVPHKVRAPRMSSCTPEIGCRATASSVRKGSTNVLTDLMYLMKNGATVSVCLRNVKATLVVATFQTHGTLHLALQCVSVYVMGASKK